MVNSTESQTIEILLNGEKRQIRAGLTVASLVESLDIRAGSVAVEHNEKVVSRGNWGHVALHSGDQVEIVRFVGGG